MSSGNGASRSCHPLVAILAAIGGLVLFSVAAFFVLVAVLAGRAGNIQVAKGPAVGVVEVKGVIQDVSSVLDDLRELGADDGVKAVVVRIDSPGGAVGASQELYQEIRRLDQEKPVVASLGNVAASGGYYAALGARYICANPGTLTGSIGVIMQIPNFGELLKKLGITTTVVKSGKYKDIGSVTRPLTKEEKGVIQAALDDVHLQFVEAVASARHLEMAKVSSIADGRFFTGRQALELGLVDELGPFGAAVDKAAQFGGIEGKPRLVKPREDKVELFRRLLEESGTRLGQGLMKGLLGGEDAVSGVR